MCYREVINCFFKKRIRKIEIFLLTVKRMRENFRKVLANVFIKLKKIVFGELKL